MEGRTGLQHPRCRWVSPPALAGLQQWGSLCGGQRAWLGVERAAWVRSRQSGGPLAGAVGAMRRLGREVTGPLSDGGRGEGAGLPQSGEGLCGPGAQVAPPPCPAFLQGGVRPLNPSPACLGRPPITTCNSPCPAPPKLPRSPWPSSQACSPPPPPNPGCRPGPTFQSPPWSRPGPPSPPPSGPSTPVLTLKPRACSARGLLFPWAHAPQPWAAPAPHPAQVPLGLLFDMHTHAHTRPGPATAALPRASAVP